MQKQHKQTDPSLMPQPGLANHPLYILRQERQCPLSNGRECIPLSDYFSSLPVRQHDLASMRLAEAIGRKAARYVASKHYPLDWSTENLCVLVGNEGLEVELRDETRAARSEGKLFNYMPLAQLRVREHYIAFVAHYNNTRDELKKVRNDAQQSSTAAS